MGGVVAEREGNLVRGEDREQQKKGELLRGSG